MATEIAIVTAIAVATTATKAPTAAERMLVGMTVIALTVVVVAAAELMMWCTPVCIKKKHLFTLF